MSEKSYVEYCSSAGELLRVTASDSGIRSITFCRDKTVESPNDHTSEACTQLEEYFSGVRRQFDLSLDPQGTAFQLQVWNALQQIPYGSTCSYLDLALRVGDEKYTRAVGMANGKNPIAIVIPCHRVIGSDGSLTGYAGGMHRKERLLEMEGAIRQQKLF
ncbi:MAG: methylated-DNA--[protein]-cysteine S-methyltransferase [Flavobacteriales bacterium]|nr:methylated-DNA--[protein]-cysteine S-methyltransferase [Flavobacteriales bacterium]